MYNMIAIRVNVLKNMAWIVCEMYSYLFGIIRSMAVSKINKHPNRNFVNNIWLLRSKLEHTPVEVKI